MVRSPDRALRRPRLMSKGVVKEMLGAQTSQPARMVMEREGRVTKFKLVEEQILPRTRALLEETEKGSPEPETEPVMEFKEAETGLEPPLKKMVSAAKMEP